MSAAMAMAAYEVACTYSSRAEMERDLARAEATLERMTTRWTGAFDRRHSIAVAELQTAMVEREAACYTYVALLEAYCHGL